MKVLRRILIGAIIPAILLVAWSLAAGSNPVVPTLGSVWEVLCNAGSPPPALDTTSLAHGAIISVLRVALGFAMAVCIGVPLGVLIGIWRPAREAFSPILSAAMAVSPIAWLPIAIIAFGLASPATVVYGRDAWRFETLDKLRFAIIVVICYGAICPIIVNAASGVLQVRNTHVELLRLLGGGRCAVLTRAILPAALPSIVTGLRLGAGVAWRVIVAAEIFPGTRSGLGHMISTAHEAAEYQYAVAAILVIAAIGLSLDGVLRLAEYRVSRWRRKEL